MSNDTKLEAKLHFFNISSFIRLDFWESGFSFEFGGGQVSPMVKSENDSQRIHIYYFFATGKVELWIPKY